MRDTANRGFRAHRVLYGLMGLINVFLGLEYAYSDRKDRKRRGDKYPSYKTARTRACFDGLRRRISGALLWLFSPVLWVLDHPVAACRFSFRYVCKAFASRKRTSGRASKHEKKTPEGKHSAEKGVDIGEPPVLPRGILRKVSREQPVLPHEILCMVSEDLHFVDLVSASRASKTLRTALLGGEGLAPEDLSDIRESTCHQGPGRRSCGMCGIQICVVS